MDSTSSSPSLRLSLSTLSRATSSTITPQQKLKNACDLCSTFKIRCDKGKPSCGRCANLGQPCSYSPARRAGRPHRLRQQQQQHQQCLPEQQAEQEQQRQQQLEGLLNITSPCLNDQPVSFAAGDFDWGNYDHDPDHDWGMQLELPAASSDATVASAGHNHAMVFTTTNKPDSATQIPLSNLQNLQINQQFQKQPPPPPAVNTSQLHPHGSSSRSEGGRTLTGDGDCAQMAASIIEQLDPKTPVCRAPPAPIKSSSCSSFNMTTSHCQRLLTILVCPCSEQPVVALLVASACIALMDAVLHQQQAPADETLSGCLSKLSPRHHHSHSLPLPVFSSLNNYSLSDQGEFEVLAKIAKVVLRFTQRYGQYEGPGGGGGGGTTSALLEPIVILLRSKLQFVTEEATGMQLNGQSI